ncbi:Hypothetical_protein [Hexamita inflata]|uniref:Hypothetical_protein n=1 Tax=Hexamita inflata TaxID=28002 RepID=A0AA86TYW1_9EUKA|nr:Hypothetical protein HINF_LOCUS21271 [Hexamita inflata]
MRGHMKTLEENFVWRKKRAGGRAQQGNVSQQASGRCSGNSREERYSQRLVWGRLLAEGQAGLDAARLGVPSIADACGRTGRAGAGGGRSWGLGSPSRPGRPGGAARAGCGGRNRELVGPGLASAYYEGVGQPEPAKSHRRRKPSATSCTVGKFGQIVVRMEVAYRSGVARRSYLVEPARRASQDQGLSHACQVQANTQVKLRTAHQIS